MVVVRILCGFLALCLSVLLLSAAAAHSRSVACAHPQLVRLGPASLTGCFTHTGARWRSPLPVSLNGLKLTGGGTITLDTHAGTITSSTSVRWLIGKVQIRRAPLLLQVKAPLHFDAIGAVRGLAFVGGATLTFTGADGGTASLATKLAIPGLTEKVSGDAVLNVSRRHGFNVQKVHVAVGQLALGRFFFKQLDFTYAAGVWAADATLRLPTFVSTGATVKGHLAIANGKPRDIAIAADGLAIPLAGGFTLTRAGLDLGFDPLIIQGSGTAVYGPPIAGQGPLVIDGRLQFTHNSVSDRWEANGKVSLPWGLPGVKPSATVSLQLDPGRAMTFSSDLDLTVHGFGLTGHVDGFASAKAFNIEGRTTLNLGVKLTGNSLLSSKGMSACGQIKLALVGRVGPKMGFGYSWGDSSLGLIGSSCDVGRFRVPLHLRTAPALLGPTTLTVRALGGFAVFAAQGGDFQVIGPTGTFTSTTDRDDAGSFAVHDTTDGWAYLVIPATTEASTYTVTPLAPTGTLTSVTVAGGLVQHADAHDITAGVTGTGQNLTLTYGIASSDLDPGETVSFYQGASPTLPGAEPIVENVTTSNTATFSPEPLGPTTRAVFAVVSIDGRPREAFPVAFFDTTPAALPAAAVFVRAPATVTFGKPQRVATWEIVTTAGDGTRDWQELPGTAASYAAPAGTAIIQATPIDQFGRAGPTYTCDTAKQGTCAAG